MSKEAVPIMRAHHEEGVNHPEGGKEFTDAFDKRVEEIKKKSAQEKKSGSLSYRQSLFWAGIKNQEDFDEKCRTAFEDYHSGNFFLERIGRYREVDVPLTVVLINLRAQWIHDYEIKTAPELMLLDMAMTSYFHFLRLNESINNMMANIEWEIFALEAPRFRINSDGDSLAKPGVDKYVAEQFAHRLNEVLRPILEQYNRMFIRNLKALRDLRRCDILLNIGSVGQVNIGDKQINVEKRVDIKGDNDI